MKLQLKTLSGVLDEEKKRYLRKKLLWLDEHLPNSSILTVGVREHVTKKSNQAYEVILHLIIPKVKKPIYARVFRNSFPEAVDIVKDKVERTVLKRKGRLSDLKFKITERLPKFQFLRRKKEDEVSQ